MVTTTACAAGYQQFEFILDRNNGTVTFQRIPGTISCLYDREVLVASGPLEETLEYRRITFKPEGRDWFSISAERSAESRRNYRDIAVDRDRQQLNRHGIQYGPVSMNSHRPRQARY